ncbi:hypothetical protein BBD42_29155 [Paenibacillus sp. BIHB 4019]|uniref:DNA-binding response regulator n=1 Tax=Paenibacillus sp. BIHB 4019 TaxID=1870819 RepID=A0A1B2DQY8_9BACL|nr:response regulator transcription factor [Paenibacillus sp. BIHB 4019]ANY70115.1 hypothetical protein BBD42_29155 [Paenibacillus sp. BIHB 4019]
MHKLLIVDDEPMIRAGLRTIIDWESLGFVWVGEAASGPEALIKHGQLAPDLILMDIRMPRMDGLQVIEEIRKIDTSCHFLVLSGHADFSYAQRAIQFGIDAYILKPVDDDELYENVVRIAGVLDKRSEQAASLGHRETLRREELLQLAVSGDAASYPEIWKELEQLTGDSAKSFQLLLIEWSRTEEHTSAASIAARRRLTSAVQSNRAGWTFSSGAYTAVLLKDYVVQEGTGELLRQWVQQAAQEQRYIAVVGEAVPALVQLPSSYEAILEAIKHSFRLSSGELHLVSGEEQALHAEADEEQLQLRLQELAQKLYYMLDIGSQDGVRLMLQEASELASTSRLSEQRIKTSFAQMLTIVLNKLTAVHVQLAIQDELRIVTDLYKQTNYDEMMALLEDRLSQLAFRLGNSSNVSVIKQITGFIERHYAENLKLETLAELFNYNSGYLGKMFKNFTGEHFNTYLDQVRLRHAVELLQQGLKVHQVSELVGYANVDYFHAKFKKYKGMSPSSFKGMVKTDAERQES